MNCSLCRDLGWVLDGHADRSPLALELLRCPIPDCSASGRDVVVLSLDAAEFDNAAMHPSGRLVMSVGNSSL